MIEHNRKQIRKNWKQKPKWQLCGKPVIKVLAYSMASTSWHPTFVAVSDGVEVDVVTVVVEEHKWEPWVKWVDGNHEQDAYNPALLTGARVVTQVLIYLTHYITLHYKVKVK